MKHEQLALFEPPAPPAMPAGFRYAPDLIDAAEEARLVDAFADLPFKEFEFHGFLGKRRVVSFGLRYDFNGGGLRDGRADAAVSAARARARRRVRGACARSTCSTL